jgi:hypothetical protein
MVIISGAEPSNNLVIISCIGEEIQGSVVFTVESQRSDREKESMPKQIYIQTVEHWQFIV